MHAPGVGPESAWGAPQPEQGRRLSFAKVRVLILLAVLLGVALKYGQVKLAESWTPDWERTEHVVVRLIVPGSLDSDEEELIGGLREYAFLGDEIASLDALRDWIKQEQRRFRPVGNSTPVGFDVQGPIAVSAMPPSPPRSGEELSFMQRYERTKAFLDYFHQIGEQNPSEAANSIYVLFYRPSEAPYLDKVHSVADRRSRSGFVFAPLNRHGIESAVINVGHELFHLFGATDKYEGQRCAFPTGYVAPFAEPRHPQEHAEVMAQGIPLGPGEKEGSLKSFDQMRVGVETAWEIGWIEQDRRDRYYAGDTSAGPKDE